MNDCTDARIATWIALLLFGVYWLSFSGQMYSQDSMLMFSVTESFVKRGEFNTDQMWTLYKARNELGPDGEAYSKTGYGTSLFAAPLYTLALILPGRLGLVQTILLTSSIVIALTGTLVFLAARRLQFSRGVSIITTLLFGLATPAWVYAKQFWSEPRLTQEADERPDGAEVIAHIVKAVRQRWWGLFTCYRIADVPSSNNDLERFFKNLKHHQRRITGRKSVHEFILRYGPFAAFIDYAESFDDLLMRLRQVRFEDFVQARRALQKVETRLKKLYRFRHHPDEYLRDLETRWEKAISASRS